MRTYDDLVYNDDFTVCYGPAIENLETFKLHSDTKIIEEEAFYNCPNLKKVIFNEGLKIIYPAAFQFCENLEEIFFPTTLKEIGDLSFYECNFKAVDLSNTKLETLNFDVFGCCKGLEVIKLPSTLKRLEDKCLCGTKIKELVLPPSVDSINPEIVDHSQKITIYANKKVDYYLPENIEVVPYTIDDLIKIGYSFRKASAILRKIEQDYEINV